MGSRRLAHPTYGTASDRAGGNVDHQGHQRGVVDERDDAVGGGGAADDLVGNADIGDLGGHADDEGEIHEVPVVGVIVLVAAGKLQAAGLAAAVVVMGVMQREGGMHRRPRQDDGGRRQRQFGSAPV